jgi:predicted ATPase/class 3 adenylate cyclase
LFSDIEGSTVLLSRLGPMYVRALDGQRGVLRKAWADHGGTELGTEGDSFFVAFPTAERAVASAAQAQRELAHFDWPGGEPVRVRMGIHTGTPAVHDGSYVGMDVHRAARIAGSAHGGQVVISEPTAKLVGRSMPEQVGLRDLGSHRLKDLPGPERLHQLIIAGLPGEFPPLKSLGAAASLPRPATPLVGRSGELAELTDLLSSPQVRLLTLTGPGGSGKTRLAIAAAQTLVERFADGTFFVPLATVSSSEVMWTTIAEVLDVPPEQRNPPGLCEHLAHRSVLLVLDNLEQLSGADGVVWQLLEVAPEVVVIATSRRPLNLSGEYVHAVPPLELPAGPGFEHVAGSGAVRLFVQHAQMVRPNFTVTSANAADIAAACRRLDGLPLAIELAAARVRLLSPAALLARLDRGLELASSGVDRPSRQQTLRATIAWSYDLLSLTQKALFRQLGVFAGGADLEAISAVSRDILVGADPLDLIAELVDASLVLITDDDTGEPRVGMLETIRAYALDRLDEAGELEFARRAHAEHYANVAEGLRSRATGDADQVLSTRWRFQLEQDNLREAMSWSLAEFHPEQAPADRVTLGLALCAPQVQLWIHVGHYTEARGWLERAVTLAGGQPSRDLARCLHGLSIFLAYQAEYDRARQFAARTVAMCRQIGDQMGLLVALSTLAERERETGYLEAARSAYEEGIALARRDGNGYALGLHLANLATLERDQSNFERALALHEEAREVANDMGDDYGALWVSHGKASTLRRMGRLTEARLHSRAHLADLLRLADPELLIAQAEECAALICVSDPQRAARLLGAVDARRDLDQIRRSPARESELAGVETRIRASLAQADWQCAYETGRNTTVEAALVEADAASIPAE